MRLQTRVAAKCLPLFSPSVLFLTCQSRLSSRLQSVHCVHFAMTAVCSCKAQTVAMTANDKKMHIAPRTVVVRTADSSTCNARANPTRHKQLITLHCSLRDWKKYIPLRTLCGIARKRLTVPVSFPYGGT